MNKVKSLLSVNIKKLRKQKKLSQDKLARLADIPYNTLIKIESSRSINPTFETLSKLADALDVSLDELTGRR
ncbi:MAG: helix-turn-helix transcriptional regulator [Candidatus Omnitrophota bacterium]